MMIIIVYALSKALNFLALIFSVFNIFWHPREEDSSSMCSRSLPSLISHHLGFFFHIGVVNLYRKERLDSTKLKKYLCMVVCPTTQVVGIW